MSIFTISFDVDIDREEGETNESMMAYAVYLAAGWLPEGFVFTVKNEETGATVDTFESSVPA